MACIQSSLSKISVGRAGSAHLAADRPRDRSLQNHQLVGTSKPLEDHFQTKTVSNRHFVNNLRIKQSQPFYILREPVEARTVAREPLLAHERVSFSPYSLSRIRLA